MLKNTFKVLIIFLLSFIAVFYSYYDLNVLIVLPLFTFAMFSGIKYMLFSLFGIASGSFVYYICFNSYNSISFFLISATIYIILFFLASLLNKRLIINYFLANLISICLTYFIYFYVNQIPLSNMSFTIVLAFFISVISSYVLKYYSLFFLSFQNDFSKLLLYSYILLAINSLILYNNKYLNYIAFFLTLLLLIIFALKNSITNTLALNACYFLLLFIYKVNLDYKIFLQLCFTSFILSITKKENRSLNSLTFLACMTIGYFINSDVSLVAYIIISLIEAVLIIYIKKENSIQKEDFYYQTYLNNKNEMILQLDNFKNMFITMSNNFYISKIDKMLNRVNTDVFNTLCSNCEKVDYCYKNKNHILLNYLRFYLSNQIDDEKINYVKNNCLKQKAYFTLLDSFTKNSLLVSYDEEKQTKMKEIIANDFISFSNVMDNCTNLINNDHLSNQNNFYKNIKNALNKEEFDVLYVIDHSTQKKYCFDIALKVISKDKINKQFLKVINEILNTEMKIQKIEYATLSSNYYIITVVEVDDITIDYAFKQSNESLNANGDTISSFSCNNHFYLLLSDGMGNGLNANQESEFAINTITSLIKSGMESKKCIDVTNDIILLKNDEDGYTTLDLLKINTKTCMAYFYKLGAVSSYLIRNNKITEINNFSLPLGVNKKTSIEPVAIKVLRNDIIILCSDGMIDDYNTNINYILEEVKIDSPIVMCDSLFTHLIEKRENKDDATLAVVLIK
ncbi:MAG: SpoIIE family protein phosphatase [Candidatus Caccosoma sp.]|nr:SpoIIE family protein phosphatase [Candidatus Caccosoma sp.]